MRSQKKINTIKKIIIYLLLLIFVFYACFPVIWMISTSFKSPGEVFQSPPKFKPRFFTTSAYMAIFTNPVKRAYFWNSIIVSLVVTTFTLFVSILTAYAFSRFEFKGKRLMNVFVINTQAVPPIALMIPFFSIIVKIKFYDTLWALISTYLVFTLPYGILMMTGYFNTISKSLDEAVEVDGGSSWTILWRILVPISLPGIVATAIYTFIQSWNEYLYALTLTRSSNMRTIPVGIQLLMGEHAYTWNEMMAMSVLGALPVLILFLFGQKYFIAGMTSGSVKS